LHQNTIEAISRHIKLSEVAFLLFGGGLVVGFYLRKRLKRLQGRACWKQLFSQIIIIEKLIAKLETTPKIQIFQ